MNQRLSIFIILLFYLDSLIYSTDSNQINTSVFIQQTNSQIELVFHTENFCKQKKIFSNYNQKKDIIFFKQKFTNLEFEQAITSLSFFNIDSNQQAQYSIKNCFALNDIQYNPDNDDQFKIFLRQTIDQNQIINNFLILYTNSANSISQVIKEKSNFQIFFISFQNQVLEIQEFMIQQEELIPIKLNDSINYDHKLSIKINPFIQSKTIIEKSSLLFQKGTQKYTLMNKFYVNTDLPLQSKIIINDSTNNFDLIFFEKTKQISYPLKIKPSTIKKNNKKQIILNFQTSKINKFLQQKKFYIEIPTFSKYKLQKMFLLFTYQTRQIDFKNNNNIFIEYEVNQSYELSSVFYSNKKKILDADIRVNSPQCHMYDSLIQDDIPPYWLILKIKDDRVFIQNSELENYCSFTYQLTKKKNFHLIITSQNKIIQINNIQQRNKDQDEIIINVNNFDFINMHCYATIRRNKVFLDFYSKDIFVVNLVFNDQGDIYYVQNQQIYHIKSKFQYDKYKEKILSRKFNLIFDQNLGKINYNEFLNIQEHSNSIRILFKGIDYNLFNQKNLSDCSISRENYEYNIEQELLEFIKTTELIIIDDFNENLSIIFMKKQMIANNLGYLQLNKNQQNKEIQLGILKPIRSFELAQPMLVQQFYMDQEHWNMFSSNNYSEISLDFIDSQLIQKKYKIPILINVNKKLLIFRISDLILDTFQIMKNITPVYVYERKNGVYQNMHQKRNDDESEFNTDEEQFSTFEQDTQRTLEWKYIIKKQSLQYLYRISLENQKISVNQYTVAQHRNRISEKPSILKYLYQNQLDAINFSDLGIENKGTKYCLFPGHSLNYCHETHYEIEIFSFQELVLFRFEITLRDDIMILFTMKDPNYQLFFLGILKRDKDLILYYRDEFDVMEKQQRIEVYKLHKSDFINFEIRLFFNKGDFNNQVNLLPAKQPLISTSLIWHFNDQDYLKQGVLGDQFYGLFYQFNDKKFLGNQEYVNDFENMIIDEENQTIDLYFNVYKINSQHEKRSFYNQRIFEEYVTKVKFLKNIREQLFEQLLDEEKSKNMCLI